MPNEAKFSSLPPYETWKARAKLEPLRAKSFEKQLSVSEEQNEAAIQAYTTGEEAYAEATKVEEVPPAEETPAEEAPAEDAEAPKEEEKAEEKKEPEIVVFVDADFPKASEDPALDEAWEWKRPVEALEPLNLKPMLAHPGGEARAGETEDADGEADGEAAEAADAAAEPA